MGSTGLRERQGLSLVRSVNLVSGKSKGQRSKLGSNMPSGIYQRPPAIDRLMDKVSPEPNTGCWLWTGALSGNGYGRFWERGRLVIPHRFLYIALIGEVPVGLELDHLCRNPLCVNPVHLEPVTHKVNMSRGQNAAKTHCPQGHLYMGDNLIFRSGGRGCRACRDFRNRLTTAKGKTK